MGEAEEAKNKRMVILLPVLVGSFLGFIGGYSLVGSFLVGEWDFTNIILFFIFLSIAVFISINVHELGHLIFGKISGYKLISYRIGFFAIDNENGRIKFSIIKNIDYIGLCAMTVPEKEVSPHNHLLYYAGGILFNMVFGIFLIVIKNIYNVNNSLNMFLIITAVISILLGTINVIPFFSGNNPSDGKIIWSMIFKRPFSDKVIEVNKLCSQISAGKSLEDVAIPSNFNIYQPDMMDTTILMYSYFKALDADDAEKCSKYINIMKQTINYIPGQLLPHVYYELCYNACINKEREKAAKYYKKAGKILQNDKDINGIRVKAYYEYYVNKNMNVAKFFCERALEVADKFPIKGQALIEEKLVKRLKTVIEEN
ncbi:site-2 protease family protein [Herbivorax sp. ANBcel31]|uniref:site-2 protease family protein n=1 Tax=Herbivorax sp. ANBcel31 TaxID=3069754 RepID=UPI0027B42477|nr:site-2 protease family protein [Herbivorax sp. ANBcel31]MDQ2084878.1 site-2 protease family protein [Herbivorax sp. ANBcel31]